MKKKIFWLILTLVAVAAGTSIYFGLQYLASSNIPPSSTDATHQINNP